MQEILAEKEDFKKASDDCSAWLDEMDIKLASLTPDDSGLGAPSESDLPDSQSRSDYESRLSLLTVCAFDIIFFLTLKRLFTCPVIG